MPFGIDKLTHEVRLLTQKVEALAHEVARQSGQLEAVKAALLAVQKELKNMPTRAEFDAAKAALLQAVKDETKQVTARIQELIDQLNNGNPVTQQDLQDLVDATTAVSNIDPDEGGPPP